MKNILFIIFIISQSILANEPKNSFEAANKLYQAAKYEQAIQMYRQASEEGKLESSELYFNLGNCFYKMHKVAPAIYNFEKAAQLNASDIEIQTNLEFARKAAIDDIKAVPTVGFKKLIQNVTASFYFDTWGYIAISCGFIFLLFFVGYYFSAASTHKRLFFIAMCIVLLSTFISLFCAFYEKNRFNSESPAIVFDALVVVKAEPKKASQDAFTLHEGAKVFIIDSVANWKKIKLADETTGWIEEKAIKKLR